MKKIYFLLTTLLSYSAFAQLATPSGNVQSTINSTTGNVGIGTNNPTEKLEVNGSLRVNNGGPHSSIILGTKNNNAIITDGLANKYYGGGYFFRVHNDNIPHKYIDALMLADNGNIGVGRHKPLEKLDINGNLRVNNGGLYSSIILGTKNNNAIISDGSDTKFYGGGYFFRVHNDNIPHKYIDALMLAENGNVGIGRNNPQNKLDINGNLRVDNGSPHSSIILGSKNNNAIITDGLANKYYGGGYFFRVHNDNIPHKYIDAVMLADNGYVGIGRHKPLEKLDVNGNLRVDNGSPHSSIILGPKNNNAIITDGSDSKYYGGGFFFRVHNDNATHKYIDALMLAENGNVGIGKNNPQNKLDVNGVIHSKEVKVDMDGWADYVFKKDYTLPTLQEVELHIQEKGHLPNIPSEKEVIENGLSVGENQKLLLQKIEELTLYIIEQNNVNKMQEEKLTQLSNEIQQLKNN